jgi:hypothetical protein
LFDMAGGDEGLRGLVKHRDSTVANAAENTLAMVRRSSINTFAGLLMVVV